MKKDKVFLSWLSVTIIFALLGMIVLAVYSCGSGFNNDMDNFVALYANTIQGTGWSPSVSAQAPRTIDADTIVIEEGKPFILKVAISNPNKTDFILQRKLLDGYEPKHPPEFRVLASLDEVRMYFDNPVKGDAFQYELQFLHPDNLRQYTPYKMPSIWVVESTSGDNSDALLVKSRDITPLVIWPVQYETPNTAAQDVLTISGGQWTVPGQVAWFEDDGTTSVSGSFIPGTVYIARVTLSAYSPRYTFQDLYEDAFSYTGATVTNPAVPTNANPDEVTVTIKFPAVFPLPVTKINITGMVTPPVTGETPNPAAQNVPTISGGQWTVPGQVAWFEEDGTTSVSGTFAQDTVYIAKVTLSAYSPRYTFQDLYEDAFSYTGATVTNPAVPTNANPDEVTVTITFKTAPPVQDQRVTETDLSSYIPTPKTGADPSPLQNGSFTAQSQYMAHVQWARVSGIPIFDESGQFDKQSVYTATVTMDAAPGWTFTGLTAADFSHNAPPTTIAMSSNNGTQMVLVLTFPKTARAGGGI